MSPKQILLKSIVILLVCVLFVACGGEKQEDSSELGTSTSSEQAATEENAFQLSELPAPEANQFTLPMITDINGRLIIRRQNTFYIAEFDGTEWTKIGEVADESGFRPTTQLVSFSPDKQTLSYIADTNSGWQLNMVDLTTLESTTVYEGSGIFQSQIWSPDGFWLAAVEINYSAGEGTNGSDSEDNLPIGRVIVTSDDGSTTHILESYVNAAGWSATEKLIVVVNTGAGQELLVFDPLSDERQEFETNGQAWQVSLGLFDPTFWGDAQELLTEFDLTLNPPFSDFYEGRYAVSPDGRTFISVPEMIDDSSSPPSGCQAMNIVRKGLTETALPEVLYQAAGQDTLSINALSWLQDDIFFTLTTSPSCNGTDALSSVIHLLPDGSTDTITDQIEQRASSPYTVSPDNRLVIWIGYDQDNNTSYLGITDLQTGDTGKLMVIDATDESSVYTGFDGAYWIAN
jgi:hypothetical protein